MSHYRLLINTDYYQMSPFLPTSLLLSLLPSPPLPASPRIFFSRTVISVENLSLGQAALVVPRSHTHRRASTAAVMRPHLSEAQSRISPHGTLDGTVSLSAYEERGIRLTPPTVPLPPDFYDGVRSGNRNGPDGLRLSTRPRFPKKRVHNIPCKVCLLRSASSLIKRLYSFLHSVVRGGAAYLHESQVENCTILLHSHYMCSEIIARRPSDSFHRPPLPYKGNQRGRSRLLHSHRV